MPTASRNPIPARARCCVLAVALAGSGVAGGQETPPEEGGGDGTRLFAKDREAPLDRTVPVLPIARIDTPPVIDGRIDDPVWEGAPLITDLRQVEPVEGADPSEATEIRILFDERHLYVAFRCFDREPDRIVATRMRRDISLEPDDRVSFVIDTFFDRRNAFFFEMNPAGAKGDALIEDNDRFRRDWDGIWYGKASIDEAGWVAEFAIPFQTISFDPRSTRWGFNASRVIRRRNESLRWSGISQNKSFTSIADAGVIEGLGDLKQGLGLDIKPFGVATFKRDSERSRSGIDLDAGVDFFYKLTPSLTLALTVNTDFAETEVDERRVNLTRFPLFFPEKRDFFLQDAGIFNFGGIGRNPLPFFSRRIGLDSGGETVDILAGVKLTGRIDNLNLGLLNVQMQHDDDLGNKNYFVGRASVNVWEESTLGTIFTYGDPQTEDENLLAGLDFNFRNSTWNGDKVVDGHAWVQASDSTDVDGLPTAYGAKLGYPNDRVDWELGYTEIPEEFNAALGFVPRRGIREYFANWRYRWRPENDFIRTIDTGVRAFYVTDLDDDVESRTLSYKYDRYSATVRTSSGRPISGRFTFRGGDFFTGTRYDYVSSIAWRPSRHFEFGGEFELNDVNLDEGDFIVRVIRARMNFYFTPDVSWSNFIQFDNVSDVLGINSRFRWIVEPGSEVFVVLNQAYDRDGSSLRVTNSELTTKVGWTFRF
jgi:hypothetical protein